MRIKPRHAAFLVPVRAVSVVVRAKMCAALTRAGLLDQVAPAVWSMPWVVHAQPAGDGTRVLDYLARYLFRIAISTSRLEQIEADHVTFRDRDNRTQTICHTTISGVEFLCRWLRHVVPRRFTKVRYYGLWTRTRRSDLERARQLLEAGPSTTTAATPSMPTPSLVALPVCPFCHAGTLSLIAILRPERRVPP